MDVDVIGVPTDDGGRMRADALESSLADRAGEGLFAAVATAGTTNLGVIDDLAGIADVCARRGIWFHVDAAYGGAALAAPSVRDRFAGIVRSRRNGSPSSWLRITSMKVVTRFF